MIDRTSRGSDGAVAIVGMSGRFPGAPDVETFWRNIADGVESIERFEDDALRAAGVDEQLISHPAYVKACGVCDDEDRFDARYFGFSPREAQAMDPQQRVFLEAAVAALEHAGLDPDTFAGPIGVYAGVGVSTYQRLIEAHPDFVDLVGGLQVLIGTNKDHLTTHVSYRLNLRGPSVGIQTACSTSLVAVVSACQALLTFQCDAALAGGVSIAVPQREGYLYEVGGIDSPDGRCRAFDARAEGTVGGNGVGIVVLRRLADAIAAGDQVHAVIRGFAVNNDGAQKVGYTAPSIQGQAEVIALAQGMAGIDPETISFIETHGTGTALGDPIEIAALTHAFRMRTSRTQFCAIGAVKTNVGHLDCAAGVAGLIKAVQALRYRQLPPSLHYTAPNPRIDFATSPFFVNTQLRPWESPFPRRAGVSSFGIGGTNAHVIVEEAPPREPSGPSRPAHLVVVSARTADALAQARRRLADHLAAEGDAPLADVAFTLQVGRRALEHRTAAVCRSTAEVVSALRAPVAALPPVMRRDVPLAFMFPGQGSQRAGMARAPYGDDRVFREAFDDCAHELQALIGQDLRGVCLSDDDEAAETLDETWLAQPALFCVQYAMAQMWLAWGVRPAAMIGHSIGEYTAACLAGVFSLTDALRIVAARGRLMQGVPRGAMLAVHSAAADLGPLPADLDLAAVNGPELTTVAGPVDVIDRFADDLRARGVVAKRLRTSHAFHSRSLDGVLDAFRREVAAVSRRVPERRYVSNVTGTWITPAEACDPDYYVRQLRGTVRFADGVQTLVADGVRACLEVGPGQALTAMVRSHLPRDAGVVVVPSSRVPGASGPEPAALDALGQLWCRGVAVDWQAFHAGERRQKVVLPGYPFERNRYWVETAAGAPAATGDDREDPDDPEDAEDPEDSDRSTRLYVPSWARGQRLVGRQIDPEPDRTGDCWLMLGDGCGLAPRLQARLAGPSRSVVRVEAGDGFEEVAPDRYRVRLSERADYERLISALVARGLWPGRIYHLWSLDSAAQQPDWAASQARGAFSLAALAQALMRTDGARPASIITVTTAALRVLDDDRVEPDRATVFGPCRTIPQEAPFLTCGVVDVVAPVDGHWPDGVVARLLLESAVGAGETTLAYRGGFRWVQTWEPIDAAADGPAPYIKPGGTYLITGGLGRLGLLIARWIASQAPVHLVLTSRTGLSPGTPRSAVDSPVGPPAESSATHARVREIEALGSTVDVRVVDVADAGAVAALCAGERGRGGAIDGVVHCAGATNARHFQSVTAVTPALWDEHFGPKVHGVRALARALEGGPPPDFVLLMSSMSAVLGGLGFMPYAAANAFMDAFVETQPQRGRTTWLSVNWDGWVLDEDIDAEAPEPDAPADGLTAAEGLWALAGILHERPAPQVLVVAGDLAPRLREWIDLADVRESPVETSPDGIDAAAHGRPVLTVPYRAPAGDVEIGLAGLWQQLLGVSPVGVDDNFFELGGHSLLAIQLAARLRERYQVDLAVDAVFAAPTVAALAAELQHRRQDPTGDDPGVEDLLRQVESMDESALRALLAADAPDQPSEADEER